MTIMIPGWMALLSVLAALNLIALLFLLARMRAPLAAAKEQWEGLERSITQNSTQLAVQMEKTRGELTLAMAREMSAGLDALRAAVDRQMGQGREEQSQSLLRVTGNLEQKFEQLAQRQTESARESRQELTTALQGVRTEVATSLQEITGQVQLKLDANIREGFAHFTKVQEHLRSAEEQLRNVGALGNSIHDLNALLRLPHLRGKFGEASLERLLADFLPASMYTLQMGPANSGGRADAMIHFPDRNLPIDAKFPREQVLALFDPDSADEASMAEARKAFERVMKEQAKRIRAYIQPENGTTDFALLYLPSETLYFETVRNRELADELNRQKVFPVSPNTLLVTLHAIHMVHKWYQLEKNLARSIEEFHKASKSFEYFEAKFEVIGKSLEKAQEAFATASSHLTRYKVRVNALGGEGQPELGFSEAPVEEEGVRGAKA